MSYAVRRREDQQAQHRDAVWLLTNPERSPVFLGISRPIQERSGSSELAGSTEWRYESPDCKLA
jgi:hypothetical protein